jgi:hypothetical protein
VAVMALAPGLRAGYLGPVEVAIPAVTLAVVAGAIAFAPRLPASGAGAVIIVSVVLGFAVSLHWGTNTPYYLAVPLWLVAAALSLAKGLA